MGAVQDWERKRSGSPLLLFTSTRTHDGRGFPGRESWGGREGEVGRGGGGEGGEIGERDWEGERQWFYW